LTLFQYFPLTRVITPYILSSLIGDTKILLKKPIIFFYVKMTRKQPCIFAIDNARYVDEKSWLFLEELSKAVTIIFVFSIRTVSSVASNLCKTAMNVLKQKNTITMSLGKSMSILCTLYFASYHSNHQILNFSNCNPVKFS